MDNSRNTLATGCQPINTYSDFIKIDLRNVTEIPSMKTAINEYFRNAQVSVLPQREHVLIVPDSSTAYENWITENFSITDLIRYVCQTKKCKFSIMRTFQEYADWVWTVPMSNRVLLNFVGNNRGNLYFSNPNFQIPDDLVDYQIPDDQKQVLETDLCMFLFMDSLVEQENKKLKRTYSYFFVKFRLTKELPSSEKSPSSKKKILPEEFSKMHLETEKKQVSEIKDADFKRIVDELNALEDGWTFKEFEVKIEQLLK